MRWLTWLKACLLETGRCLIGSEHSRRRQLKALGALDDRLLRDIGLTPAEARRGFPIVPPLAPKAPRDATARRNVLRADAFGLRPFPRAPR